MAAPVVKLDLVGTSLSLGIESSEATQAVRHAYISGLAGFGDTGGGTNTTLELLSAIQACVVAATEVHPSVGGALPLASVSVQKYGATQALARLVYRRSGWSRVLGAPGERATFTMASDDVEVYRTTVFQNGSPAGFLFGLPNGMMPISPEQGKDPKFVPPYSIFRRPIIRMLIVSTTSGSPIIPNFAFAFQHTNSSQYPLPPYSFNPNTVRFDGASAQSVQGFSVRRNRTVFSFSINEAGWLRQTPFFNPALTPPQWDTYTVPIYPDTDFPVPP